MNFDPTEITFFLKLNKMRVQSELSTWLPYSKGRHLGGDEKKSIQKRR
jgi:hypothetical protein